MKALSIRQPWAWAILNGKDIENRNWRTTYRGEFFIHAGKNFDHAGYLWIIENKHLFAVAIPEISDFQLGGVVGKAVIVDCVEADPSPFFFGAFGFKLVDPEPVDFIPCKGRLNFFSIT